MTRFRTPGSMPQQDLSKPANDDPPVERPLRSAYSKSFVQLLADSHLTVWVTTYQAGKLVILRPNDAGRLDTQARSFLMPMGLALQQDRFAIGSAGVIQEFRNDPKIAGSISPAGQYDAAYVPRTIHATGDIKIHEMGWEQDQLWFVNTRFSCLCNRSVDYNFVPRWKPAFISKLAAEDRCHLNGLAMVDDKPRYVTALGETDTEFGWRSNKRDGGIVIDVRSNQIICRGLSMPHSPRWHQEKLWVLESGSGGLGTIDLGTGRYTQIIALPGFTRGLQFHGPYAFVGLSQVRETAAFGGLAITELPVESRFCGIWVVDTRTGHIAAFLKFQHTIQEIFSVAVVQGHQYPLVINSDTEILGLSYSLPPEA
jgi:uncharacterized protein (TIGR03032 family)